METKIKKLEGNQNKILEGKQNLKKKKCNTEIRHPWAIVLLFFEKMLAESLYKMIFIRCLFSKVFMKVCWLSYVRRNHLQVLFQTAVLKYFAQFTENTYTYIESYFW